jgi:hypothetical protein
MRMGISLKEIGKMISKIHTLHTITPMVINTLVTWKTEKDMERVN